MTASRTGGGDGRTHPGTDVAILPGAVVGPGGGVVILDNERVRIWDVSLDPGEKSKLHTHLSDYVLVQIEGDEVCNEPHPDSQGYYNKRMVAKTSPGDVSYVEKGGTETAVNTGAKRWREIVIELK